jgi:hypothetical protein
VQVPGHLPRNDMLKCSTDCFDHTVKTVKTVTTAAYSNCAG